MSSTLPALKSRMRDIANLRSTLSVLEWDLQTYMPPGGAAARAEQIGLLSRLSHELFTSPETGRLLEDAEQDSASSDPDSDDTRIVRNVRRDYDRAVKIPVALAEQVAQHAALSQRVWEEARAASDFAAFAPSLQRTLELTRQVAALIGHTDDPYDALLDEYEPGATTQEVSAAFEGLKPHLVELTRAIVEAGPNGDAPLVGHYPVERQVAVTKQVVQALGYDMNRGRQDVAAHPFCTEFSRDDVRITTRFNPERLDSALYASLHEAGHALYEQGVPANYERTPLGGGASMAIHESQSRLWENLVGRSRAFSEYVLPQLATAFPEALGSVTSDRYYRAVNCVAPSLIRVEADEVTYNLHVLMRFELERELLADRISVTDLPEAWNSRMREYLGLTPPDDAQGVLQDVHWAGGMLGYFPTYTLGTVLSSQIWHAASRDLPELNEQIAAGQFSPLLDWLRSHIHCYGRKFLPRELIIKATGEPLNADYYVTYLRSKYGELYNLS